MRKICCPQLTQAWAEAGLYTVLAFTRTWSVRGRVRPSRVIFRRVLGASCAVYPVLFHDERAEGNEARAREHTNG